MVDSDPAVSAFHLKKKMIHFDVEFEGIGGQDEILRRTIFQINI